MKEFTEYSFKMLLMAAWLAGIVIAEGFWSTFFAIFFAPYSFYLVVEQALMMHGIVT